MKYHLWLKQHLILTDDLLRTANARPYDPNAYNEIIDQLNSLKPPSFRHKRRRDWWSITILIMLALALANLVYRIVLILLIRGP